MTPVLRSAALALLLLGSAALTACASSVEEPSPAPLQEDSQLKVERKPLSPEERKAIVRAFAEGNQATDKWNLADEVAYALGADDRFRYSGPVSIISIVAGYDRSWYGGPREFASKTDLEIIQILIDSGFNVNAGSGTKADASTPLHTAASHGDVELLKVLIAGGADLNKNVLGSALSRAAQFNYTEAAKLLIDAGAHLNVIGQFGNNALNEAAQSNSVDVAKILLEAGMDVDLTSGSYGFFTPLHDAVGFGHPEFAKLLLEAGADSNAENKYEQTPLIFAASSWVFPVTKNKERIGKRGQIDIVHMMIESGADVNHVSGYGYTPLNQAAQAGHAEITETLIEAGADVNLTAASYGFFTPLHNAAEYGHLDVVQILIEAGAHLNATNKFGDNPLSLASQGGHGDVVDALIQAGAEEI